MDKKVAELQKKIAELENEIKQVKGVVEKPVPLKEKQIIPSKTLYSWIAPSRVFIQRNRAWFLTVSFFALIFILLFAFLQDMMMIVVVCMMVLILFLLASVKPGEVEHKITNKGIKSIEQMFKWSELKEFWVTEKSGHKLLFVTTNLRFPAKLVMLLAEHEEQKVVSLIGDYLPYKDYPEKEGWLTKLSDGKMIKPEKYVSKFTTPKVGKDFSKVTSPKSDLDQEQKK